MNCNADSVSAFGEWTRAEDLPAFACTAGPRQWDPLIDPPSTKNVVHLGNRRITLVADSDGLCGVWDEYVDCRWIAEHTGECDLSGLTAPGKILFGPTFLRVTKADDDVVLERTVLCPEGESPWLLIRVDITSKTALRPTLTERWEVRQRLVSLEFGPPRGETPPATAVVVLEEIGGTRVETADGTLTVERHLDLVPERTTTVWFRFGIDDGPVDTAVYENSLRRLRERLPRASSEYAPEAEIEIPWHAAMLTGAACVDGLLGGHTLDQGSAYSFRHGFNGAARDPLQHALPLVYFEPDLALSVLRNTCAWGSPDGDLPYALDGRKQPWTQLFRPSDQNLWALWLGAEYVSATGDVQALAEPVPYHPIHQAEPVSLGEHLRRQFRFFVDQVGLGERGHVRILNADWNDVAIVESGVDREWMVEHGESVLNSAMAAWVLPVYAQIADPDTAAEARELADDLRLRVADEWNGRWFRRAYGTGPIGDDELWLEVQPWAILSGAAEPEQARDLLRTIDETCRAGSPLGARVRWPTPGAVWFSINMTLIWAAARHNPDMAWDEWRRMTLHSHAAAYPDMWSGTLSGPDAYLPPESDRPGETWAMPDMGVAMQAYPVANLHSHSQPLLAYLRLLGVEPGRQDRLSGGTFHPNVP